MTPHGVIMLNLSLQHSGQREPNDKPTASHDDAQSYQPFKLRVATLDVSCHVPASC